MTVQPKHWIFQSEATHQQVVPASQYSFAELADIYNQTRVDYIVPMPMNARRMAEYVQHYDINLDVSPVVMTNDGDLTGLGMLGVRGDRAWISRLGVLPASRGRRTGSLLMERLLEGARAHHARLIQLEVIKGNEPAYRLFDKFGFSMVRELRIIRRPPGHPDPALLPEGAIAMPMSADSIFEQLEQRPVDVTWLEESRSLINAGGLQGLRVMLPGGSKGWIICQSTAFHIGHVVLGLPDPTDVALATALLYYLHEHFAGQDTKTENVPVDDPAWPAFQALGYLEAFRRIEMVRTV